MDPERAARDQAAVRAAYQELFDRVSEILVRFDPIGIIFEDNTDEYEPEVGTIVPRLRYVTTVDAVRFVVYEEFVRWFDPEIAGPENGYEAIAREIWDLRRLFPAKLQAPQ